MRSVAVAVAFCMLLSSSFAAPAPEKPAADSTQAIPADFVIGLEDVLSVVVWKEPDLSVKEVIVRPDGKISLPLVSEIQASGLTPKQLEEQIANRMKEFLASPPNVSVVVVRIASQSVSIVGQVVKQGIYLIGAPVTVLELLARAGGFREGANTKNITILRTEGTRTTPFFFNYDEVSKGRRLEQNLTLKNGDSIIVR